MKKPNPQESNDSFSKMDRMLGLLKNVEKKEIKILMIGLDAAGKTTAIYKLSRGEFETTISGRGPCVETIKQKNVIINSWDVGGCVCRSMWSFTDFLKRKNFKNQFFLSLQINKIYPMQ